MWPSAQPFKAMNPVRVQAPRSDQPVRREQPGPMFSGPNPQVFMPLRPCVSISTVIAMCVMHRGLCVISGVLNDLCSMCYWVALLEISMGLTLKLRFILGRLQWSGPTSQEGDLTGLKEPKAARSALFQMSSWCKMLLTTICDASVPILSHRVACMY